MKFKIKIKNRSIITVYDTFLEYFKKHFKYEGPCSKYMLEKPTLCNSCCKSNYFAKLFCECMCNIKTTY
jgi:hypothetical protein